MEDFEVGELGLIAGLWAEKFDQIAAFQNFIIMPMTFLSGVFYSVGSLPPFWSAASHLNPFFYMIDGFRYGLTGHADGSLLIGLVVMTATNFLAAFASYRLVASGWRLTS